MALVERVDGEFQGRTFAVRRGYPTDEPAEQARGPKWWVLEFDGKRAELMADPRRIGLKGASAW